MKRSGVSELQELGERAGVGVIRVVIRKESFNSLSLAEKCRRWGTIGGARKAITCRG